jgi:hypothetical protein
MIRRLLTIIDLRHRNLILIREGGLLASGLVHWEGRPRGIWQAIGGGLGNLRNGTIIHMVDMIMEREAQDLVQVVVQGIQAADLVQQ